MNQAPVTRPVAWASLVPQLLCLGGLVGVARLVLGSDWSEAFLVGAGLYLVYSFGSRAVLAREHKAGMRLTKRGRFAEAIPHYERSLDFFERHPSIDRWRAVTMLSSGRLTYREMALVNIAFCYSQVGEGERAEAYYRRTLADYPDNVIARTALRLMESVRQGSASGAAEPAAVGRPGA